MPNSRNLYLVTGNDAALVAAEAARLFREFAGDPPDPFASDLFEEGDEGPTPELLFSALRSLKSPAFLGGRKTVWLKHFTGFDQEGDKKSAAPMAIALRELADLLKEGLPPDMVLIMDGDGVDRRRGLFKACSANGEVIVLNRPDMAKDRNWRSSMQEALQRAIQRKGMQMSRDAFDYLLDALGTDTARIEPELEKIACFRGDAQGPVPLADVQQVVVGRGEEMTWALAEMLGKRSIHEALRVIDVLITQNRSDDQYARSMIYSAGGFFRNILRVQVFMGTHRLKTPVALKQFVQTMTAEQKKSALADGMDFIDYHPYRVQMMAEQAARYSPFEAMDAITTMRNALWQITSCSTSPRMALESALLKIIGTGR